MRMRLCGLLLVVLLGRNSVVGFSSSLTSVPRTDIYRRHRVSPQRCAATRHPRIVTSSRMTADGSRGVTSLFSSTGEDSPENPGGEEEATPQDEADAKVTTNDNNTNIDDDNDGNEEEKPVTLGQRLKQYFAKQDDGLTFRQRLAKLGLAVVLSYGFVSNMSYCVSVSAAWYIFSKRVRTYIGRKMQDLRIHARFFEVTHARP